MAVTLIKTIGTTRVEHHSHLMKLDGKTPWPYKYIVQKLGYSLGDAVYTFHASYLSEAEAIAGAEKFDATVEPGRHAALIALYAEQEAEWALRANEPELPAAKPAYYCSSCGCETTLAEMQKYGDVATMYCGC